VDVEAVRAEIILRDESEAEALGDAQLRAVVIDTSQVADWYRQAQSILITDLPQEHNWTGYMLTRTWMRRSIKR